jgi:hypothetical protein
MAYWSWYRLVLALSVMRFGIIIAIGLMLLTACDNANTVKPFDISKARDVSFAELEAQTHDLPYFLYWGRTNGFAYFGTLAGAVYRLPESVFPLPPERGWKPGAAGLYVTIRDGRITVPPPGAVQR